ncbi:MAG: HNH endonuclease [Caulobacteraceae bacterium]|nr:HNH endonuclease [Caulobacteraceae bacterium]
MRGMSIEQKINEWSIPEPNSGCWLWLGSVDRCGYGKISAGRETLAHRASYKIFKGFICEGNEIDHLCKTRSCVNPSHLESVTHAENIARADYTKNHRNGVKTQCKHGHQFTKENTTIEIWKGRPRRKCKTCTLASQRQRAKKKLVEARYGIRILET